MIRASVRAAKILRDALNAKPSFFSCSRRPNKSVSRATAPRVSVNRNTVSVSNRASPAPNSAIAQTATIKVPAPLFLILTMIKSRLQPLSCK